MSSLGILSYLKLKLKLTIPIYGKAIFLEYISIARLMLIPPHLFIS